MSDRGLWERDWVYWLAMIGPKRNGLLRHTHTILRLLRNWPEQPKFLQ